MIRNTAVTVCGPLNVNKLGVTYVHEHLMVKPQLPDEYYIPYTLDDETASCIYTQKGNKKIRKPQAANQTALIFDRRAAARLLSINSIRRLCWS